jgi:hypothetical protein
MGAGGIVNQRAAVLIPVVTHPSFFGYLSPSDQTRVMDIQSRGALACDEGDVRYMGQLVDHVAKHR